jgi:hypothetical protein
MSEAKSMKVKSLSGLSILLICSILATSFFIQPVTAQLPALEEEWPIPPPPPMYASWSGVALAYGYSATGPVIRGGIAFSIDILDRHQNIRKADEFFVADDMPLSCRISAPPDSALNFVTGIIEYHPPSYDIRVLLPDTVNRFIGTAGSASTIGQIHRGTADPEGKYALRVGLMSLIRLAPATWRWYFVEGIVYYDYKIKITPTPTTLKPTLILTISCNPSTSTIKPGEDVNVGVNVQAVQGIPEQAVTLLIRGAIDKGFARLDPNILPPSQVAGTARLIISTDKETKPGAYQLEVECISGSARDVTTFTLIVGERPIVERPEFQIALISAIAIAIIASILILHRRWPSKAPPPPTPVGLITPPPKPKPGYPVHRPQVVEVRKKEK